MVNCSHCGTQNRDGSKFCGNCGARMSPPSGLVCPMCGTANKMESVFCLSCGARLVPLTVAPAAEKPQPVAPPIKGLSLPARESPGELPAEIQKIDAEETPPTAGKQEEDFPRIDQSLVSPPAEIAAAEEEDVPDWLKSVQPPSDVTPPVKEELEPATEIPDWLQKIRPVELPAEEPAAEIVDDAQIPDWLRTANQAEETPVVPEPIVQAEEPKVETLEATELTQPTTEETVVTPAAEEAHVAEPLMESLEANTATELFDDVAKPAWAIQTSSTSAESDEDIPDWLRTLPASSEIGAEPTELLLGAEAAPNIQPAMPGEVPDWLASLKPTSQLVEDDTVESSGPLEGLRGVLPLALAVTEPHPKPKSVQSVGKSDGGQLFESILAAPGVETTPATVAVKRRVWTMRPLVYLLMAIAVLVPFFLPSDWASSSLPISGTLAAEFYDTLQTLPANSTVLVSFDYDASQSGEMDLIASAILRHLIQRRAKIIAVSALDTGAPIAKRILDNATRNLTGYAYGANYVNLGYLPGHEAGLLQLATSGFPTNARDFAQSQGLNSFPGFSSVKTLRDVAMMVVLAGSEDSLKTWMEQVQPRANVKIVAGVSAGVEPKARVYHAPPTKQLTAMVSGVAGAAQYEILSNQPGQALININTQSVVQLALVFVIVLGNIVYLFSRGRKQNV